MLQGNTTAKSNYELVANWNIPTTRDLVYSFVSLCNDYIKISPFFQLKVILLCQLQIKIHRKTIPMPAYTLNIKNLF